MKKEVKDGEETLEFKEKYTYNKDTDVYVTPLKSRAKPLVLSGAKHRAIIKSLSNLISASQTVEEVALKYSIPVRYLEEYKKVHSITRDSLPLSSEEILENSIETNATQLLEEKKFSIAQAYEKLDWKDTQKDATAWREFQAERLDPFALALETWEPPKLKAFPTPQGQVKGKTLVIGLSDLHFGSAANARYMFNRPSWSTENTVEAVDKYATKIIGVIYERTYQFNKAVILGLGDLIHSINGKTSRGTELKYDCVREEQLEYALTSIAAFITRILGVIPKVDVHSVYGNHNYETEMALFRALEMAFSKDDRIKFYHYSSRPASFREGNTLLLLDHGYDSLEKVYVPAGSDSKLQLHVQSLLLSNPEILIGIKHRIFCMGDKHHWENIEYNDFEFFMFGTVLGSDEHANVLNLRNRPRQSCLVLDDDGVSEILHVFFD